MKRPKPPKSVRQSLLAVFAPAPDIERWIRATYLSQESRFYNPDHEHLNSAEIGILWTNVINQRHMRRIVGEARLAQPQARGKWARAREEMQMREWFGERELDFLITLDAMACQKMADVEFYALIDHELYHCGQARDEFGCPRFSRETGRPVFALRGHDVEEFIGVVRRWGPSDGDTRDLITAGNEAPELNLSNIARLCGVAA